MPSTEPTTEPSGLRLFVRRVQRRPSYRAVKLALHVAKRLLPSTWRLATQRYRQLPSAVIVGAQKAGTTQLYASLVRHPRCLGGVKKEVHYFSRHADRSVRWYRAHFPLARTLARVGGIAIEATPAYLTTPRGLQQMRNVLPDVKVIVLFRDPVARAFSHYQHYKTRHLEPRSFADAIGDALARHPVRPDRDWPRRPDAAPLLDYVGRGYYALQLEALWHAYPRQQVLVLDSGELFEDTNAVCQRVFDFLGLEHRDVEPQKIYNRGYYREQIDPATAQVLREHYRPHDALLAALTGRSFRWIDAAATKSAA